MLKGIVQASTYYAIGLGAAAVAYATVPYTYHHAPGLHHILIFFTFLGGLLWMLVALAKALLNGLTPQLKGMALTHLFMLAGFGVVMFYLWE